MSAGVSQVGSRALRIAIAAAGCIAVGLALFGHRFGVRQTPGFGLTQALLLVAGVGAAGAAWAGRRTPALYREAALITFNTILLLVCLELLAAAVLPVSGFVEVLPKPAKRSSYYAAQPWSRIYWQEFDRAHGNHRYHPYFLWRMQPFEGELINVGPDGLRETPGAQCVRGAYTVHVFGGSTVWGQGAPDSGTVPAHLQRALRPLVGRPVCIRNFGQPGSNSTQDLIQLLRELQAGRVPNLAIFYVGVNEVYPAARFGAAGVHYELDKIAGRVEAALDEPGETAGLNARLLTRSNLYRLASLIMTRSAGHSKPGLVADEAGSQASDTLAASIAHTFLANYRVIESVSRDFGFQAAVFWQPNLFVGGKPLTEEERHLAFGDLVAPLLRKVYQRVGAAAAHYEHLHDISRTFEHEAGLVYVDLHHLTPEGNRLVAEAIAERLVAVPFAAQGTAP